MRRSKTPLITTRVDTGSVLHPRVLHRTRDSGGHAATSQVSGGAHHSDRLLLRIPAAHRDTTAVLGGGYPFLTGPAATEGMFVGHDTTTGQRFCFDPWQLYSKQIVSNTNLVIVGNVGWGKTNTAMALALRGIASGYRVLVPGDPKNDWTRLAAALGGQAIRLGPGSPDRLNPLDLGTPPADAEPQ